MMYIRPHPGEFIREVCLEPLKLSVTEAAYKLGVTRKALSELLNGRVGISTIMALRLAKAFNTTPESWLTQQMQYDLWKIQQEKVDIDATPIWVKKNYHPLIHKTKHTCHQKKMAREGK